MYVVRNESSGGEYVCGDQPSARAALLEGLAAVAVHQGNLEVQFLDYRIAAAYDFADSALVVRPDGEHCRFSVYLV